MLQGDIHLVVERGYSQHQATEIVGLGSLAGHSQVDLWMAFLVSGSQYVVRKNVLVGVVGMTGVVAETGHVMVTVGQLVVVDQVMECDHSNGDRKSVV